jgi:nitrogen fixation-related uncharacterized protein
MDTNLIIIIAIAVVLFFLILRFAKKVLRFILIVILAGALALFGFLYLNKIDSIEDLEAKYCEDPSNEKDSLKCVCIVQPIKDDFNERLTKEERNDMGSVEFAKELSVSMLNKRQIILQKLKENKAENLFDEFKKDLLINGN